MWQKKQCGGREKDAEIEKYRLGYRYICEKGGTQREKGKWKKGGYTEREREM